MSLTAACRNLEQCVGPYTVVRFKCGGASSGLAGPGFQLNADFLWFVSSYKIIPLCSAPNSIMLSRRLNAASTSLFLEHVQLIFVCSWYTLYACFVAVQGLNARRAVLACYTTQNHRISLSNSVIWFTIQWFGSQWANLVSLLSLSKPRGEGRRGAEGFQDMSCEG